MREDTHLFSSLLFSSLLFTDRPSARVNPISVNLDDIDEQDEVTGTVVRVSNYGVFVDIGAGVDAFLHRRKMKVRVSEIILKRRFFFRSYDLPFLSVALLVFLCLFVVRSFEIPDLTSQSIPALKIFS